MGDYDLNAYGAMVEDRARIAAYARALELAVSPGDTVLDIGTGTGIFALIACRLGAGHVIAVEPDDVIELAAEIAHANGYGSRIEFVQDVSTNLPGDRKADVIVSDLRGVLPFHRTAVATMIDARERLLAPGGRLIPQIDRVFAGLADASGLYGELTNVWSAGIEGFDLSAGRSLVTNAARTNLIGAEALIGTPRCWAQIDYRVVEGPNGQGSVEWEIEEPRACYGFCVWFDSELADGVELSNAPGAGDLAYWRLFLPFSNPLELLAGERVTARLGAEQFDGDYIYRWAVEVRTAGGAPRVALSQSTSYGIPRTAASLRRSAPTHRPALRGEGVVDRFVLERMDGEATVEEIATALREAFPAEFPGIEDAVARVARLSRRYSV